MLSAETHTGNREASGEESYGRFLYNRHRYYDPSIGRYVSADPIGQSGGNDANLYRYVWANPANWIDPLGLAGAFGGRRPGESLLECMDRLAKEFYGDALAASDALAITSAATAAATAASSAAASAAEFVAKDAAASAKVGGATTSGSIVQKRAAANAAARSGGRIAAGRAVLGAASKASGVATVGATALSAGARAAFYPDCKDPHPCDEESSDEE